MANLEKIRQYYSQIITMNKKFKININEVLSFFDEVPEGSIKQATPLIALFGEELCTALLQDYLNKQKGYRSAFILCDEKVGEPLVPFKGTNKGKRLDRWMVSTDANGKEELFQIEIKNWSSHSIKGQALSKIGGDLEEFAKYNWKAHIMDKGDFVARNMDRLGKTLIRMNAPSGYENHQQKIIPLLCLWLYVQHPKTRKSPFFEYKLKAGDFNSLYIFSASAYLRQMRDAGKRIIILDMPLTAKKINWIQRIFGNSFLVS